MYIIFLVAIAILPLLMYMIDGYYEKNIKRGVLQILAFIITGILIIILMQVTSFAVVFMIPFMLLFFVLFFKKNN